MVMMMIWNVSVSSVSQTLNLESPNYEDNVLFACHGVLGNRSSGLPESAHCIRIHGGCPDEFFSLVFPRHGLPS